MSQAAMHKRPIYILLAIAIAITLSASFYSYAQKIVSKAIYSDEEKSKWVVYFTEELQGKPYQLDSIRDVMRLTFEKGAYNDVIDMSAQIYRHGKASWQDKLTMTGALFMGQSYCILSIADSMNLYLNEALRLAYLYGDHFTISRAYNSLGIHAVINEMNYRKGLGNYHKALDAAGRLNDDYHLAIKGNLAYAYYYRNDPAGLKYAREVYEKGKQGSNPYRIFTGAFTSACMYYLLGDHDQALRYVEEALDMVDDYYGHVSVYTLYGDILDAIGLKREARESYLQAFSWFEESEPSVIVDTYFSYGRYLLKGGNTEAAIAILEEGIGFALENNISMQRYKLYHTLSEAYRKEGREGIALQYYMLYHQESDSLFSLEREWSLNELRISYEAERQENELQQKELLLVKGRQQQNLLAFILLITLTILIAFYIYHRRRNKMYLHIVKHYRELKQEANVPLPAVKEKEKPLRDDAAEEELFSQLEELMKKERTYRENDLTVDKLAKLLGTNRPYLSRVIGNKSGRNYNGYVNSLRIREAIEILSDPDDKTPLKALAAQLGFNSLSVFYSSFQGEIGVPPSKFRENWRKIDLEESIEKSK